ncbi:hypothetical protein [Paenibacillus donghaensis]|uniref:Uncharacterized protein n=1 Tax=Paenibacillus donghaensis TaxID=414771 RepID=A0A2Z2KB19_9BACL|nr:hypothetical protein [Paenibacillus donghaensis]ASA23906.1 hypothetical protein B9T62_25860 [Paenibacillus donghaensis]
MESKKPEWYERADHSPFAQKKFTDVHADQVVRALHRRDAGRKPARAKMLRLKMTAAASFVLLAGVAAVTWGGAGLEQSGETAKLAESQLSKVQQAAKAPAAVTEQTMLKNAEDKVEELYGKRLTLVKDNEGSSKDITMFTIIENNVSANVMVDNQTGKVSSANVSSIIPVAEVKPQIIETAKAKLKQYGYKGKGEISDVNLSKVYDLQLAKNAKSAISLTVDKNKAHVQFIDETFYSLALYLENSQVNKEAVTAAQKALKQFAGKQGDELLRGTRNIYNKSDTLMLLYKKSYTVRYDNKTKRVIAVSDLSSMARNNEDIAKLTALEKDLLKNGGAKLRSKVEPLAKGVFGQDIKNYKLAKEDNTRVGYVVFYTAGQPEIRVNYDINLKILELEQLPAGTAKITAK